MLIAIFIQQSIKQQVEIASLAKERLSVRLELENVQAKLYRSLLSHQRYQDKNSTDEIVKLWNFHGEPFYLDSVKVTVQDVQGLINLNTSPRSLLKRYFSPWVDEKLMPQLLDAVEDWKDEDNLRRLNGAEKQDYDKGVTPSNTYLQHVNEFNLIAEHLKLTDIIPPIAYRFVTVQRLAGFNPLNAPEPALNAFLNDENLVKQVLSARARGELSRFQFFQMTGIEEGEFVTFGTSPFLEVELSASRNGVLITKRVKLKVNPRARKNALTIFNVVWY
nr:type II secretion system protein GspK [Pseudoalteromonas caenipelagi]